MQEWTQTRTQTISKFTLYIFCFSTFRLKIMCIRVRICRETCRETYLFKIIKVVQNYSPARENVLLMYINNTRFIRKFRFFRDFFDFSLSP